MIKTKLLHIQTYGHFFLIACICILFAACDDDDGIIPRVDDPDPIDSLFVDCSPDYSEEVIESDTIPADFPCVQLGTIVYFSEQYQYQKPVFNPSNNNQIAFIKEDVGGGGTYTLTTFDFCTGHVNELSTNVLFGIDWSSKDWIIYGGFDQNIYKIKSDGDSLTQLTFDGESLYPTWNDRGTAFSHNTQLDSSWVSMIRNEDGDFLEELDIAHLAFTKWTNDYLYYACENPTCLGRLNTETMEREVMFENKDWGRIYVAHHTSTLNEIIFDNNFFVRVDLNNLQPEIINTNASDRVSSLYDISSDGKKLLIERTNIKEIGPCEEIIDIDIYMMNTDGTNKRKILIPE